MPSNQANAVEERIDRTMPDDVIECYGEGMTPQYHIKPTGSQGGEGRLYEVLGNPSLVAKVVTLPRAKNLPCNSLSLVTDAGVAVSIGNGC